MNIELRVLLFYMVISFFLFVPIILKLKHSYINTNIKTPSYINDTQPQPLRQEDPEVINKIIHHKKQSKRRRAIHFIKNKFQNFKNRISKYFYFSTNHPKIDNIIYDKISRNKLFYEELKILNITEHQLDIINKYLESPVLKNSKVKQLAVEANISINSKLVYRYLATCDWCDSYYGYRY